MGLKKRRTSFGRIMEKTWETLMVHKNSEKLYSKRNFYRKKYVTAQWPFADTVPDHNN